ncbi:MAG: Lrp/AsnC family transcriptional regulator [Alphaproteobacteria bacterium]|nr:Lrp/AsnC family transcriptional regulator [Alphaproteobacteria bacterium]
MTLSETDLRLLDRFQRDFPLEPRPFRAVAEQMGISEDDALAAFARLKEAGALSRIGAVVTPHAAGHSTLAALAVPRDRLEDVAALVSAQPEVNHNYEREHRFNLWFVVTAADEAAVAGVLKRIEAATELAALDLPLTRSHHIDLGFPLS